MLRGALAAAVTPLRDEGATLDEEAFRPYVGREATISGAVGSTHLSSEGYAVLAGVIHEALVARGLVTEPRAER